MNRTKLPKSMGNDFMIVRDVDHAIRMNLNEVNKYVEKHGKAAKEIHAARAAFGRLQILHEMALDESTHNSGELKSEYWRNLSKQNAKPC